MRTAQYLRARRSLLIVLLSTVVLIGTGLMDLAVWFGLGLGRWAYLVVYGTMALAVVVVIMMLFQRDIARRARRTSGRCRVCGYNLEGNVSGVCPECGRPIRGERAARDKSVRPTDSPVR